MAQYAIGIDLGTSNCALEWSALQQSAEEVSTFQIRQYETPERVVDSEVLPSYLYLGEKAKPDGVPYWTGLVAREQFKSEPARCIHSAKSWLCHPGVDREGSILPWQSPEVPPAQQLSPVAASAAYLSYLKDAWDSVLLRIRRSSVCAAASHGHCSGQLRPGGPAPDLKGGGGGFQRHPLAGGTAGGLSGLGQ